MEVDHAVAPDPYYPPKSATVVSTRDVDYDFRPGVEVRFGSTFTIGDSCNTCNSGCTARLQRLQTCGDCCPAMPADHVRLGSRLVGYRQRRRKNMSSRIRPTTRIYGMKSFAGLEYDHEPAVRTLSAR